MRHAKILVATMLALSALVLSLHILGQARADAPGLNTIQQQLASPPSDLAARDPVTVSLWLMPDFEEKKVWVDGTVSPGHGIRVRDITYHLKMLLPFSEVVSWVDSPWIEHHCFGWWEGSQITPSHQLTGAYELHLPGLDLQPEDALNIYLVSGIILTDTFLPRTITPTTQIITPTNPTSATTGTLGIALDFTPTAAIGTTPTAVLTGSYTLTGLVLSPAAGEFVVSQTVTLIADYTLSEPSFSPITDIATQTVTSSPFSYTLEVWGDYSLLSLHSFSQPVTLTVPFYPFEKAIDLTLTPLLVETTMTRTASAMGGATVRKLRGAEYQYRSGGRIYTDSIPYAQSGLLGRGDIRLRIPTPADDPLRNPIALIAAFRRDYRQEGLNRLLERHLDFPSFPIADSVGELNPHKETIVEVVTEEMSGTARSYASDLTLQAPFQLNVWRALKMLPGCETLVVTSTSTPASSLMRGSQLYSNIPCAEENPNFDYASDIFELYDFPDFNRCIGGRGDKQVLQMGLGRVMLGPDDVLTLTIESVSWVSLDPLPDELKDYWQQGLGGPERSGFTAVYRGPRSFWLDIRYTPHPSLFARQSVATIRGRSRVWEYQLGGLWTELVREPVRKELLFSVGLEPSGDLNADQMPEELRQEFESRQIHLSRAARVETQETDRRWRISDRSREYLIVRKNQSLRIYQSGHIDYKKESWLSIIASIGLLLIMWIPYQWTTPERAKEDPGEEKNQGRESNSVGDLQVLLDRLRKLRRNRKVHVLLRSCLVLLFLVLGLMLENSFVGGILAQGSRPFAIALVCGALLLLRWEKALLLIVVGVIGIVVDIRLASQYTSDVQNAVTFSSATGMLSGATSVAMLIITLAWAGMMCWWSRTKKPRFQLQHRDLHAFTFFGLAAAVFEVTDACLFALWVLFLAWFALSLILDKAKPLQGKTRPPAPASSQSPPFGEGDAQASNSTSEKSSNESPETPPQSGPAAQETADAVPADKASNQGEPETVEALTDKLGRFLKPAPIGAILAAAIVLSRDPLLRMQLVSFAQSASPQNAWIVLLDPLARLATTLVPCLAIVLLTVILDTSLEHWLQRAEPLDTYLKAIPLTFVLFSIFALGIGGLSLFTGTLGVKLSDRIVYYVTIPLLTSMWVDWKTVEGENIFAQLNNAFEKNLGDVKKWITIILTLLSILAPRLISAATPEQFEEVIKTLQF